MNSEKLLFGFFIILSLTLNFGFFLGEIDNPAHHHPFELFAAIVVNLIATILKFGDRTQIGALMLATSLAAMLQLTAAALVWALAAYNGNAHEAVVIASVVSLAGGALLANFISVVLLVVESVLLRR